MSTPDTITEERWGGPLQGGLPAALRCSDLRKTYVGTRALKGVSLSIPRGEFRALVGANGSGKSTLVGILGGRIAADDGGHVEVFGEPLRQREPAASRALGIAIIHQELLIVPHLSAMENVFLGDWPRHAGRVDWHRMRREFVELADNLGIEIAPGTPARDLSVAQQTLLEILRAARRRVRILIMDEPSVALGAEMRERLYEIIETLRGEGVTFLLISHDLDEVVRLSDSVTVFRDGTLVKTAPKAEWSKAKLVAAMLGDQIADALVEGRMEDQDAAALEIAMLTGTRDAPAEAEAVSAPSRDRLLLRVRDVQAGAKVAVEELTVAPGEILGVAGLVGSGRSSLLRAIAGAFPGSSGEMDVDGDPVRWPRNVRQALDYGVALLPEDRKRHGLVLDLPSYDNATLADLPAVARAGVLAKGRSVLRAQELLQGIEFRGDVAKPVRTLSGGNQQKVMIAKWLHRGPRILLIDEPTRGIDIGAKRDMMKVIDQLASEGHGIVWVSSEFEELAAVSHRVLLLVRGRMVGELNGADITVAAMLERIFHSTRGDGDHVAPPSASPQSSHEPPRSTRGHDI